MATGIDLLQHNIEWPWRLRRDELYEVASVYLENGGGCDVVDGSCSCNRDGACPGRGERRSSADPTAQLIAAVPVSAIVPRQFQIQPSAGEMRRPAFCPVAHHLPIAPLFVRRRPVH